MPKNKNVLVFALGLLVLTISLTLNFTENSVAPSSKLSHEKSEPTPSTLDTPRPTTEKISALNSFSPEKISALITGSSLSGTQAPGALQLDQNGKLIINSSTKDILDYFLSLSGEMPNDRIRQIIFSWANNTASLSAANELMELLERYQHYQQAFASGDYAASDLSELPQKMAERRAMRDEIMGRKISADMFASDDAYDAYSLTRLAIMQSDKSDAAKQRELEALTASLPPEISNDLHQQNALISLHQYERKMRQTGATDAEIYTYRQQEFGSAAAQRLEALDQQRSQWQQRYQTYQDRKDQITQSGLAAADQQSQIEEVRAEMFNQTEQLRVTAMERIGATPYQ